MINFRRFMIESGAPAGKYEIHVTDYKEALKVVSGWFGSDVRKQIPDFEKNYHLAQKLANLGHTKRSEMPVILSRQIPKFKRMLRDNNIKVEKFSMEAKKLKPIQQQIYLDRSIERAGRLGIDQVYSYVSKEISIKSRDNYIIDGHHRWLSAILVDPNMKINGISVDLPIEELLPLARDFGDSIGNRRNR